MKKNYTLLTSTLLACFFLSTTVNSQTSVGEQVVQPSQGSISANKIVPASSVRATADLSNSRGVKSLWLADSNSMPGKLKAFHKNKGQFLNLMNDWKISYGADCHVNPNIIYQ